MTLEGPRERKFAQLVANHLVGDVDRNVLLAVVHGNRQSDEFRKDHRATRPGLDGFLVLVGHRLVGLLGQVVVDERTFFE